MDKVEIKIVNKSSFINPVYASEGSSGFDIRTNLNDFTLDELNNRLGARFSVLEPISENPVNKIVLYPNGRYLFPTGLYVSIPKGKEIQIRPRSGNAIKHGITCLNSPGTIDADYRGEIGVILINTSNVVVTISNGDKIAQGVLCDVYQCKFVDVDTLDDTSRGDGGFGKSDTTNYK